MSNRTAARSGRRLLERTLARFRRSLERQFDEVKGRVNGLIFLLAGSVAAQLILKITG